MLGHGKGQLPGPRPHHHDSGGPGLVLGAIIDGGATATSSKTKKEPYPIYRSEVAEMLGFTGTQAVPKHIHISVGRGTTTGCSTPGTPVLPLSVIC